MDQPDLPRDVHDAALTGLSRINRLSFTAWSLWEPIEAAAKQRKNLRVLDIATGAGDIPRSLHRLALARKVSLKISGCDLSEQAVEIARARAREERSKVEFFQLDALGDTLPRDFDVLTCSLFLHHLGEQDIGALLSKMARATRHLVVINDLIRCVPGYLLAATVPRVLSRSRVVHHDALRSVEAALKLEEIKRIAENAGLTGGLLQTRWPYRFLYTWRKGK